MTEDAECEAEIRARSYKGQTVNKALQNLRKGHDILITTKIKLWKTLVGLWQHTGVTQRGCHAQTLTECGFGGRT